jgi:hypothetical protein
MNEERLIETLHTEAATEGERSPEIRNPWAAWICTASKPAAFARDAAREKSSIVRLISSSVIACGREKVVRSGIAEGAKGILARKILVLICLPPCASCKVILYCPVYSFRDHSGFNGSIKRKGS